MNTDYNDYLILYEVVYELDVSLTTIYNLLRYKKLSEFKVEKFGVYRETLYKK